MGNVEKVLETLLEEQDTTGQHELVLFNDDVNTFDDVITALIRICEHSSVQAEQCSLIVHYQGKCTVKTGGYAYLRPKCFKLLEAGLSAEIIGVDAS